MCCHASQAYLLLLGQNRGLFSACAIGCRPLQLQGHRTSGAGTFAEALRPILPTNNAGQEIELRAPCVSIDSPGYTLLVIKTAIKLHRDQCLHTGRAASYRCRYADRRVL